MLNSAGVYGENLTTFPANTWVRVAGEISSYGSKPAQGWISIFAVAENWADGWCAFVVPPLLTAHVLIYPPPQFDFTLSIAMIVNASVVELDYDTSDFWTSGFWGINNATNPKYIIDVARLAKDMRVAHGEFNVKGNWTFFALNIQGFESIQGNITSYCVRKNHDGDGQPPYSDINRDCIIDIRDIARIAVCFGSSLGFDRYEFYADINFDLKIDVTDVAKCALCYGREY